MPHPNPFTELRRSIMATLDQEGLGKAAVQSVENALDSYVAVEEMNAFASPLIHWPVGLTEPATVEISHEDEGHMFPTIKVTMPNGATIRQTLASNPDEKPWPSQLGQSGPWMDYLQQGDVDSFGYVTWAEVDLAMSASLVAVQQSRVEQDKALGLAPVAAAQ